MAKQDIKILDVADINSLLPKESVNNSIYSDAFMEDYKKNPFFTITFKNIGNVEGNEIVVTYYDNSNVAYPALGAPSLAVDDYNFKGFSFSGNSNQLIDLTTVPFSSVPYERILSGETTVNNYFIHAVYEEPTSNEGEDKVFTINYYYEGGTEKAHQSEEITVTEDGGNVEHTLPVIDGATTTDGKTTITLKYENNELVRNIYYTKDTNDQASVKVSLEFVNANGKEVSETIKFDLPVGSYTSVSIADILAMPAVIDYMNSKHIVNNKTNDDNIRMITVMPNEADGSHNKDNFIGSIVLNKIEYTVNIKDLRGTTYQSFDIIHGESFKTPTASSIGYGDEGTQVTWLVTNNDDNSTMEVKANKNVTVTANIDVTPIVKHTISYVDGDGKVIGTQMVEHGFAGKLTPPTVEPYNFRYFSGWKLMSLGLITDDDYNITFGAINRPVTIEALYGGVASELLPVASMIDSYTRPFNDKKVEVSELGITLTSVDGNTVYTMGVDYDVLFGEDRFSLSDEFPKIKNVSGANGSQEVFYTVVLNTTSKKSAFYGLTGIPFSGNNNSYVGYIDFTITPIEFTIALDDVSVPVGASLSSTDIEESVQAQIDAALAGTGINDTAYAKDLGDMTLSYLQTLVNKAGTYENAIGLELLKKGKVTIDGKTYKFNNKNYKVTIEHGDLTVYSLVVPVPTPTTPPTEQTVEAAATTPAPAPVPAPPVDEDDEQVEIVDPTAPLAPTVDTEDETTDIEDAQVPTTDAPEMSQNGFYIWIVGLGLAIVMGGIIVFVAKKKKAAK